MNPNPNQNTAVILKLRGREYKALRSFVESSMRPEYEWNKPIYNKLTFRYDRPGGTIVVATDTEYGCCKEWKLYVGSSGRVLIIGKMSIIVGTLINTYVLSPNFTIICYNDDNKCRIHQNEQSSNIEVDAMNIFFTSNDVPFARTIALKEVVEKMKRYQRTDFNIVELDATSGEEEAEEEEEAEQ